MREGRLLMVEEYAQGRRVLNQPAGHLEPDETLLEAALRETREETAWDIRLTAFVGAYQWKAGETGRHYLRFAFAGEPVQHDPQRQLDEGAGTASQSAGLAGGAGLSGWAPLSVGHVATPGMSIPRIIVGVSGGVDSSVAALQLVQAGEPVAGLFMQNWADDGSGECRAEQDRRDAVAVCGRLGIAFHFRDFSREYWQGVFEHFLAEYAAGRTPNPDVLCNREVKFKHFLEAAQALGAEKIATGHYARIARQGGHWHLLRGVDRDKDQSYFLHQLGQAQLSATLFPIGQMRKQDLRRLAREAGLPTHDKKDSTGICFIGERDFRQFLARYLPARPGQMQDPQGQVIGEHPGVFYFTLGQREGLQIGGIRGRPAAPWYVVGKDVTHNILYVDQDTHSPYLHAQRLWSEPAHWTTGSPPAQQFECTAQTRYRQADEACTVTVGGDGGLAVVFARPQRAVTPGQSVVLYDGDICLGASRLSHQFSERVLALAALAQTLHQVRRIAETGHSEASVVQTALDSVFRLDADDTASVFGRAAELRPGLRLLHGYLVKENKDDALPRLSIAVLQLERRFVRNPHLVQAIGQGVQQLSAQAAQLGSTHPDLIAALGNLYADTISQVRPRIMVQGNPHYLGQPGVVAEIRALLLAAVRAAVLWRQLGGSYWDILFSRRAMTAAIDDWLQSS
ncbi:hypothetical protein FQR65_LT20325 [Abscondita terminalis]|nr:hypothetical protein FQR65_LT20325 [Abscondita terminalis]